MASLREQVLNMVADGEELKPEEVSVITIFDQLTLSKISNSSHIIAIVQQPDP